MQSYSLKYLVFIILLLLNNKTNGIIKMVRLSVVKNRYGIISTFFINNLLRDVFSSNPFF